MVEADSAEVSEYTEENADAEPLTDESVSAENDDYECPECGGKITINMTTCPNCGIGLSFEYEDEE